jgi:nucleoside-diphosphate-sugar epimerase
LVLLVTGGTGLVGGFLTSKIAEESSLMERGCRVIIRNSTDKELVEKQGLTAIKADLTDQISLKKALTDVTSVFHLAARADDWATWEELYKVNVDGLNNLVSVMRDSNSDPFLIHASSTGVYGHFIPSFPIEESFIFNPTSIYQKSKYYQEKLLWKLRDEEGWDNYTITRPPSIIGPRDKKTILPMFKAVFEGKFPILRGGKQYATFIHPDDLCTAMILQEANQSKTRGEAYNLKSFECRIIDFVSYVSDVIKAQKPLKSRNYQLVYTAAVLSELYSKITGRKTLLNRYRVTKFSLSRRYDDSKIVKDINFIPEKNMETTIEESYQWLKSNDLFP